MARGERRQRPQRALPVLARLVRIDGRRIEHLASPVDDGDFDARPQPRVETHRRALSGRRGEQQVVQVAAEHADRFRLGQLAQPLLAVDLEVREHSHLPRPAHRLGEPRVRRPAFLFDAGFPGNPALGLRRARGAFFIRQHDGEPQDAFLAPAHQREDAVRRHVLQPLGGAEIVGELNAFGFLARHDSRSPFAAFPHELPQSADELGILGKLLHQDPARAFERRGRVRDPLLRIDVGGGRIFGHESGILQQREGEWLEPGLDSDLRPRAPFRLVRQIQIFEPRLRVRGVEHRGQLRREFPLGRDALDDRGPPILELAKVCQPLVERAQLRVVEPAGGFLAVAGDEGHGGFVIEQRDGGLDLGHAHLELVSNSSSDGDHGVGSTDESKPLYGRGARDFKAGQSRS